MKTGALYRAGSSDCLVPEARCTTNVWERMRGLLGRPALTAGQGFLIDPCPSVHTVGMGYPLDLAFLDRQWRVLRLVRHLPPLRWAGCATARATLELPPGALDAAGIAAGDVLEWRAA
ncbi:MAG: DUF192 domain-containing protein [Burkholderiaceae bacterium]|nr:DUF192 domain-containing protein [Burkholderiaceae bacterium]